MKKLCIVSWLLLVGTCAVAQAPQGINYQAVVRDNLGAPLTNTTVGMRIQIRQGSPTGTIVYAESFSPTSSSAGLVNFVIGQGNVLTGTFTSIAWNNGIYFCEVGVDVAGGTSYVNMGAQQFMSVPYALYAETSGSASGGGVTLDGAYDFGGPGSGRIVTVDSGPIILNASGSNTAGMAVLMTGTGNSIQVENNNPSNGYAALQALTNSSNTNNSAIYGRSSGASRAITGEITSTATGDAAVRGLNQRTNGGMGVEGVGYNGVAGSSAYNQGYGIYGSNSSSPNIGSGYNAIGVAGIGGVGVVGQTTNGQLTGVMGQNFNTGMTYNNIGIYGESTTGVGVWGQGVSFYGVYANGDFGASGIKAFVIDHPFNPSQQYLRHFSIESNEVLNIYRGSVVLDSQGEATITLPTYVEAINTDYSYHLTPVGAFAPLYISQKMLNGSFGIAGGMAGMEVSWQLVAQRNDPYLQHHPEKREVEPMKRSGEQGKYLMPGLYQMPDSYRINAIQQMPVAIPAQD